MSEENSRRTIDTIIKALGMGMGLWAVFTAINAQAEQRAINKIRNSQKTEEASPYKESISNTIENLVNLAENQNDFIFQDNGNKTYNVIAMDDNKLYLLMNNVNPKVSKNNNITIRVYNIRKGEKKPKNLKQLQDFQRKHEEIYGVLISQYVHNPTILVLEGTKTDPKILKKVYGKSPTDALFNIFKEFSDVYNGNTKPNNKVPNYNGKPLKYPEYKQKIDPNYQAPLRRAL